MGYLRKVKILSRYSGKCDLYDSLITIHGFTEEEIKTNVNIYVGANKDPLHIESIKDVIPYYPHLVS